MSPFCAHAASGRRVLPVDAELEHALSRLHAVARGDARSLPFEKKHLVTTGHELTMTDAGALDLLGSINDSLLYDDLIGSSDELGVTGLRDCACTPEPSA